MRMLMSVLLSLLAITSVAADGMGEYNNKQAQQQASIDRQNTITVQANQGILLVSRSLIYNPATNISKAVTAYDEVDIQVATFPADPYASLYGGFRGKVEIMIDNLNITQTGAGRRADLSINEFAFAWRPFSIVQYVEKSGGQNGFDVNDTLCHEYELRPTGQNPFTFKWLSSAPIQADNGTTTLHTFQGVSKDNVFKLIVKATGATGTGNTASANSHGKSVWIDGRFVSPTSIKFDVIIDVNQPGFKLNTSSACHDFQIAIKSWARSMQDVFARTTTQQTVNGTTTNHRQTTFLERIQTGGDATPFGFFTWAQTANVTKFNDTTTTQGQVLATSLVKITNDEDQDNLRVTKQAIHSFDTIRPGIINWDPELGSDSQNPDSSSTPAPGTTTGKVNGATMTSLSFVALVATIMAIFAQ